MRQSTKADKKVQEWDELRNIIGKSMLQDMNEYVLTKYLPMLGSEDWKRSNFPPTCCITFFAALSAGPVHVLTVRTGEKENNRNKREEDRRVDER